MKKACGMCQSISHDHRIIVATANRSPLLVDPTTQQWEHRSYCSHKTHVVKTTKRTGSYLTESLQTSRKRNH